MTEETLVLEEDSRDTGRVSPQVMQSHYLEKDMRSAQDLFFGAQFGKSDDEWTAQLKISRWNGQVMT